ncbi:NUDIX hydrolase [Amycolatopsis sp. NBC_01286]|uniref:NUDIX hydrolase n=1 Tax=Amycolatopsis sp. NBC_01286 TaxID=2903560 RepID=UPI002E115EF5|nr:NUDIX hydrolase [Amycolatopsis sp. NBC_01286]
MSLIGSLAAKIAARFDDRTPVYYAADVVLFTRSENLSYVLLIERAWNPHKGKLALPGGHVDPDETSHEAARREGTEETGVDLAGVDLSLVGIYDQPDRDARGRYVTVAYTAFLPGMPTATAGDDAAAAAWVPLRAAYGQAMRARMAFDHERILFDAARMHPELSHWPHT